MEILEEKSIKSKTRSYEESRDYIDQAVGLVPDYFQPSNSIGYEDIRGYPPICIVRGEGSHIFDLDGNEYIDFTQFQGNTILGHNYPAVTDAIFRHLKDGIFFSPMHPIKVELAGILKEVIPCCESVRFSANAFEAVLTGIFSAREYTGKKKVAAYSIQGALKWLDLAAETSSVIPEKFKDDVESFECGDLECLKSVLEKHPDNMACVVIDPVLAENFHDGFLKQLRDLCDKHKAVLIFNETETCFKIAVGGAQKYFGVMPDIAVFGDGIANGMPLAAVVGKQDIVNAGKKQLFPYNSNINVIALAAAAVTIRELKDKAICQYLRKIGRTFQSGYNRLADEYDIPTKCAGIAPCCFLKFYDNNGAKSDSVKFSFLQEAFKRGMLFSEMLNFCYNHTDTDIDNALNVVEELFKSIKFQQDKNPSGFKADNIVKPHTR